jgi:hypothetical protein
MRRYTSLVSLGVAIFLSACGSDSESGIKENLIDLSEAWEPTSIQTPRSAQNALFVTYPVVTDQIINNAIDITEPFSFSISNVDFNINNAAMRSTNSYSGACNKQGSFTFTWTPRTRLFHYDNCIMVDGYIMNGTLDVRDIDSQSFYDIDHASLIFDLNISSEGAVDMLDVVVDYASSGHDTISMTMNGTIANVFENQTIQATYNDYSVVSTNTLKEIEGTVKINNTPELCASNGVYTIKTLSGSPLNFTDDHTLIAGEMDINDKAHYEFHANQSTTISINGNSKRIDQTDLTTCSF